MIQYENVIPSGDNWFEKMYQLKPEPPKMPLNKYIRLYKETGDNLYFQFFLHTYEPQLNRRTQRIIERYCLADRYADVKQTIILALLSKLPEYDLSYGVDFLKYADIHIRSFINEYIRIYGSCYSVQKENHYKALKKVSAIYYDNPDKTLDERVQLIKKQTSYSERTIHALITESTDFRYYESFDPHYDEADDDDITPQKYVSDHSADPGVVVPFALYMDEVIDSVEKLTYKQQKILYASSGIQCIYCGRIGKRKTYAELANDFELYSESAIEKLRKKAIEDILRDLSAKGIIHTLKIRLAKKKEKHGKLIYAKYAYQPDLDGEEGIIELDLAKPAHDGHTIEKLADWDTMTSNKYAHHVIDEVAEMKECGDFAIEVVLTVY